MDSKLLDIDKSFLKVNRNLLHKLTREIFVVKFASGIFSNCEIQDKWDM